MTTPQAAVYQSTPPQTPPRPERRGISGRRVIDEAKAKVPVIDLADLLCGPGKMRRLGGEWLARCPLPDHEDRTPSFTVNPEKNVWFCHGCVRGGDVVELARFAWGYGKHEVAMAAANLLHQYGHPIPPRPASWFKKQERQGPFRNAIQDARVLHYQRRVFRIFAPLIASVEDEDERREEEHLLWEVAGEIAARLVARRAL